MAWDVFSGMAERVWIFFVEGGRNGVWDVLSGVANLCGMFCQGCEKMTLDVFSPDTLSYIQFILKIQTKIVSEYDQEIPQSQTAENPKAPRGRATQQSRHNRKTN